MYACGCHVRCSDELLECFESVLDDLRVMLSRYDLIILRQTEVLETLTPALPRIPQENSQQSSAGSPPSCKSFEPL